MTELDAGHRPLCAIAPGSGRLGSVAAPVISSPQGAYDDGLAGLVRVGPLGAAAGMSKLVEVHFLEMVARGESAVLALRWEATGPGSRLFLP